MDAVDTFDNGRFQSTLPVWGATQDFRIGQIICIISIHAPRVGSDEAEAFTPEEMTYFNPRSPCGERPLHAYVFGSRSYFNPRSPCGERRLLMFSPAIL